MCFLLFPFLYHILRLASPLVRCWLREMSIIIYIVTSSSPHSLSSSPLEFKGQRRRTPVSLVSCCRSACRLYVCYFLLQTLSCFCSFKNSLTNWQHPPPMSFFFQPSFFSPSWPWIVRTPAQLLKAYLRKCLEKTGYGLLVKK